MTYFRREIKQKIFIPFENLCFHFDSESDSDDEAHPLIHAHIFSNKKPQVEIPSHVPYKNKVDWEKLKGRLNSFRLPVPNMNFPSVLCCLVASHLGAEKTRKLLDKTKDIRKNFPGLTLNQNQRELLSGNSFAGSQWFEGV